jgi:hypothetical protein
LINALKTAVIPDVFLNESADIIYMKKENVNGLNYLFVNAVNSEVNAVVKLHLDNKDCKIRLYNPITDENIPLDAKIKADSAVFDLCLPAYGFMIVRL